MNNAQTEFPRLIKIPVWGQSAGLSRTQSYAVAEKFPPGVVVRLGHRLRLNPERLKAFLEAGGDLSLTPRQSEELQGRAVQ